jgi:pimeloyl-ACP methyl ester carboxylesterase
MDVRDLFVSAGDGLRLYARDRGALAAPALPVVCLPGLTRNADDFDVLARRLATDPERPRRVLALDYRGRGRSDRDPDWRNYDVRVELEDVLQVMAAAGIAEAVFVGTSRGGLITMGLSAARPALVRGAVLNDIGPVIEGRGLVRIRGYVGRLPAPANEAQAADILKNLFDAQFPRLQDEDWRRWARATWTNVDGHLVPAYDPALMKTLETVDLEAPLPALWHLFQGLKPVPVLALRGANSDLLSAETLRAMGKAHPRLEARIVPDQGHAPLLTDKPTLDAVAAFVRRVEEAPALGAGA